MKKHFLISSKFCAHMRRTIRFLTLVVFFSGLHTTVHAQKMKKHEGTIVVCPGKFEDMHTQHGIPEPSPLFLKENTNKTPTANFEITFGPGALANVEVQAAFQFALDIWATEIVSPVPIRVFVDFATLGEGVLASAGPTHQLSNFPGAPDPNVVYPAALANSIAGEILDPSEPYDLVVNLGNSIPFYFGTDGNTPAGQFDFVTIALHEAGHGLGFTTKRGFNPISRTGTLRSDGDPSVYSLFMVDGDGNRLLDLEDPSTALGDTFIGGDLFVDGTFAKAALAGTLPKIYAPAIFAGGSSLAHWDEATYPAGDPNSLMSPQVGRAESIFDIGAITRGHFKDMGWVLNDDDAPQIILSPGTFSETTEVDTILTKEITISSISDNDLTITVSTPESSFISFSEEPTFLLATAETKVLKVTFDTSGISKGFYEEEIIFSIEGDDTTLSIPVSLRVLDGTEVPKIRVNPESFSETVEQLSVTTKELIIENIGDDDLNYTMTIHNNEPTPFADRVATSMNTIKEFGFQNIKPISFTGARTVNQPFLGITNSTKKSLATSLYATSFEEFELGDLNGQLGWVSQYNDNWLISNENAFEGDQHFRAISDGLGSTRNAFILALSPIVETTGEEPFTVFNAKVNIQGSGVTWEVIPATANPQTLATRLRFKPDGTIETLTQGNFVPVPAMTPSGYFDLKITVDRDDASFAIYFDGNLVFSGQGAAVAIEQIILLSNMEVEGSTFDIDNFEITDGDEDAGFLSVTPTIGVVPFLSSTSATVKFDARALTPGSYTASINVSSDDSTNPNIIIPVDLTVIAPPTLVANPESISASVDVTIDDPAIKTATFTISNTGGNLLEFESVLGSIGFTPETNSFYNDPLAHLDLKDYGEGQIGVFSEKTTNIFGRVDSTKKRNQLENNTIYSDSIFYDSGITFPDNFSGLETAAYTSAIRFETPNDFTLTAIRNGYRTETLVNPTVILEIYKGGTTPDQGELMHTQTFEQGAAEGIVATEVLNKSLFFTTGETFWVVHKYPTGIQYPQGTDDNGTQRSNTYFFSSDGGASYQSSGYLFFIRALTGGSNNSYITLEPDTSSIAPGASLDVLVTFDGSRLVNGTYNTPIILNSNDPINPKVTVGTTFKVSGQKSVLELSEELLLFDSVFIGDTKEAGIRLTNSGLAAINLSSISSDNEAFVVEDIAQTLSAGASTIIPVTFIPQVTGNNNGIISIESDADNIATVQVIVNGVGVAPPVAVLSPDTVMTEVPIRSTTTSQIRLTNNGDAPLVYSFPEFAVNKMLNDPNVLLNNTSYIDFEDFPKDKNTFDSRVGPEILYNLGTDNTYGYTWIDSDEVGGPVYNYQDIATTGTNVVETIGADGSEKIAIDFPFEFYGISYQSLYINANGFVSFQEPSSISFINDQIPNVDDNNNLIAAFWDDIEPQKVDGAVYYQNFEDRFVVQYTNVRRFLRDDSETITFQIVLYPNGNIEFFYEDVSSASFLNEATIGIENSDGTDGAQVAFNTTYLKDGLAVRFIKPEIAGANFITSISSLSGVIPAGGSKNLTVTLDAGTLIPGTYTDALTVSSNSPDTSSSTTTFELTVYDVAEVLNLDLVDAATNEVITTITEGSTINLASFSTDDFNIVANIVSLQPKSVVFDFDDTLKYRTENNAPYALGGDFDGDYVTLPLEIGAHTVTATPYMGSNATGTVGIPRTVNFNIIDNDLPLISDFVLINADTDKVIGDLSDGAIINTSLLGTKNLNVVAVAGLEPMNYVVFRLNDAINFRTESTQPYSLAGDVGEDFRGLQFPLGENTLTATPYTAVPKKAGRSLTVTFTVIDTSIDNSLSIKSITPNPGEAIAKFVVSNPKGGSLEAYMVNLLGNSVLAPFNFPIDINGNGRVDMSYIQQGAYIFVIRNTFGETTQVQIVK